MQTEWKEKSIDLRSLIKKPEKVRRRKDIVTVIEEYRNLNGSGFFFNQEIETETGTPTSLSYRILTVTEQNISYFASVM